MIGSEEINMELKTEYVNSKITGGHYAFLGERSKKPFTNKMKEAMSIQLREDDVVADIGAYVGEYALYAIRNGAKRVKCYEPTPSTYEILTKNAGAGIETYNAAIVGDDSKTVTLHMANGIGVTNSIAKSNRKINAIEVAAIKYDDAVADATVVKIDVEGAEYSYDIFKEHIRAYIIEFHTVQGIDWKNNAMRIIQQLESNGYRAVCSPGFNHGFDLNGAWVKE
jgi:FkbM family methyltransferase